MPDSKSTSTSVCFFVPSPLLWDFLLYFVFGEVKVQTPRIVAFTNKSEEVLAAFGATHSFLIRFGSTGPTEPVDTNIFLLAPHYFTLVETIANLMKPSSQLFANSRRSFWVSRAAASLSHTGSKLFCPSSKNQLLPTLPFTP